MVHEDSPICAYPCWLGVLYWRDVDVALCLALKTNKNLDRSRFADDDRLEDGQLGFELQGAFGVLPSGDALWIFLLLIAMKQRAASCTDGKESTLSKSCALCCSALAGSVHALDRLHNRRHKHLATLHHVIALAITSCLLLKVLQIRDCADASRRLTNTFFPDGTGSISAHEFVLVSTVAAQ